MTFKEIPYGSDEWREAVALRETVLRVPLGSTFSAEELEEERKHIHIGGYIDEALVATTVLVPEGESVKMQRVAVVDSSRNQNIGSQMMVFCEARGRQLNAKVMYCHARDTAVNFYLRNHYTGQGDYFDEDGIPHRKMSKNL